MNKRFLAGTAAALLAAVSFLPCRANAISAQKAILVDGKTGRVLLERKADDKSLIASTTKIMTAIIICEQTNVLDRVSIPKEAVGIEGSSMYLLEGEILTIQELLYGLMLHSGNDAAMALAIYCGGTVEGFAGLMNDKARQLEMTGSHFVNPNGLDHPEHYSTARDLAILTAYAMENPIFARTVATKTVTVGHRVLRNHNKLLWRVDGADGVKTGYTKAAGRILVSSALRDGRRLIAVTINDGNDWKDHATLLNDGFSRYSVRRLIEAGQKLGELAVIGGQADRVGIVAAKPFVLSVASGENVTCQLSGQPFVYASVVRGAKGPDAYVLIDGKVVGKVPTVYTDTVEQEIPQKKPSFWEKLFGGKQ